MWVFKIYFKVHNCYISTSESFVLTFEVCYKNFLLLFHFYPVQSLFISPSIIQIFYFMNSLVLCPLFVFPTNPECSLSSI